MLTSHSNYERYKMHHVAYFCELQQNQRVLKSFLKILRFQTALMYKLSRAVPSSPHNILERSRTF